MLSKIQCGRREKNWRDLYIIISDGHVGCRQYTSALGGTRAVQTFGPNRARARVAALPANPNQSGIGDWPGTQDGRPELRRVQGIPAQVSSTRWTQAIPLSYTVAPVRSTTATPPPHRYPRRGSLVWPGIDPARWPPSFSSWRIPFSLRIGGSLQVDAWSRCCSAHRPAPHIACPERGLIH